MRIIMVDNLYTNSIDFHSDKVEQTKDMTVLQRQNNHTLTDKRENKNLPRFAFLKISMEFKN